MKTKVVTLIFLTILSFSLISAEIDFPGSKANGNASPPLNPWNETVIISPTWQTLVGTFFGLNLKGVPTELSVREVLVLMAIFVMFFVIILDIIKMTPFFKMELGPVSGRIIATLIITILVSISGALISLKDIFLNGVAYTVDKITWAWVASGISEGMFTLIGWRHVTSGKPTTLTTIITAIGVIIAFILIWQFLDWLNPIIKKYSKVSKAEAAGRLINKNTEN